MRAACVQTQSCETKSVSGLREGEAKGRGRTTHVGPESESDVAHHGGAGASSVVLNGSEGTGGARSREEREGEERALGHGENGG